MCSWSGSLTLTLFKVTIPFLLDQAFERAEGFIHDLGGIHVASKENGSDISAFGLNLPLILKSPGIICINQITV